MTAMSNMPDVTRNIMSFALAIGFERKQPFCPRKTHYRPISEGKFIKTPCHFKYFAWPDPIRHPKSVNLGPLTSALQNSGIEASRNMVQVGKESCVVDSDLVEFFLDELAPVWRYEDPPDWTDWFEGITADGEH